MLAVCVYAALHISALDSIVLRGMAWLAYWFSAGVVATGIWVLAHECGHQAFSASRLVNDTVGWIFHSALLVPYFSWQISHAHHHANTCSVENDEVFVPWTRSQLLPGVSKTAAPSAVAEMLEATPLASAFGLFRQLLFGWPAYLSVNASGPIKYTGLSNSHFNPMSALYSAKQRGLIVLSDIGFFLAVGALVAAALTHGALNVFFFYGVPYLLVNGSVTLLTFLQHTDVYVPHYRDPQFSWLRGALSTVDRSFGPIIDVLWHHITDTHVCHHLIHAIPFYHAQEATEAMKSVLGPYYMEDKTPILTAALRAYRECQYIPDEGDIVFYEGPARLREAEKRD